MEGASRAQKKERKELRECDRGLSDNSCLIEVYKTNK
jgi:hypothetical protein